MADTSTTLTNVSTSLIIKALDGSDMTTSTVKYINPAVSNDVLARWARMLHDTFMYTTISSIEREDTGDLPLTFGG